MSAYGDKNSITLDDLILSRCCEYKKRINSIIPSECGFLSMKNDILAEVNYFLAFLGNEKLPIERKNVELSTSITRGKFFVYALEYLHNLDEDLKDYNV